MTTKQESTEKKILENVWSLILLRGIALLVLGLILLIFPMATLTTMIIVMGAWWLIDGIITSYKSFIGRKQNKAWTWGIFTGILGAIAGIIVLSHPSFSAIITTSFIVWFLAISALIYGLNSIITGIRLRKEIKGEWSMIIGGVFSVFLGFILMFSPVLSVLSIMKIIGFISIIGGATLGIVAFGARKKTTE